MLEANCSCQTHEGESAAIPNGEIYKKTLGIIGL